MGIFSNSTIGSSSVVEPSVKGDITTFSNAIVNLGISPALTGKVLTQKITAPTGLEWKSPVGNKGGLLTNDGTNTKELPVGTNNKVLTANSSATDGTGLEWKTPQNLNFTAKGDLESFTGSVPKILPVGTDGQILSAKGSATSGVGMEWINGTPLTTEGDILFRGTTINNRLSIGATGRILTVVSNKPSWQLNPVSIVSSKGDLLTSTGVSQGKLGVGTNDFVLTADSSATNGLGIDWKKSKSSTFRQVMYNSRKVLFDFSANNTQTQPIPFDGNTALTLSELTATPAFSEFVIPESGQIGNFVFKVNSINLVGVTSFEMRITIGVTGQEKVSSVFNSVGEKGNQSLFDVVAGDILKFSAEVFLGVAVAGDKFTVSQFSWEYIES